MKQHPYPLKRIGIIGGGQLARMMIYQTKKMGFDFTILDADPQAGASAIADRQIVAGLYDAAGLEELVSSCEVTTYDIEHTDTAVLKKLEDAGHTIVPSPRVLELIQDKQRQKEVYEQAGLPMAPFVRKTLDQLTPADFPVVQKTRTGGYDGRGVQVLRSPADLPKALGGATFLEQLIPFAKELAVMVVRGQDGQTQVYPVVEMVFDPQLNICDQILAPAPVSADIAEKAQDIAVRTVEALGGVGIFGVELFLLADGQILVNETAPRPHNSGHYTMEGCRVCQFENHIRAVAGLPLAEPGFHSPSVMVNLLGSGQGSPVLHGLDQALAVPGFSLHLYGKTETRPGRKMGHFTVADKNLESALANARAIQVYLQITGDKK